MTVKKLWNSFPYPKTDKLRRHLKHIQILNESCNKISNKNLLQKLNDPLLAANTYKRSVLYYILDVNFSLGGVHNLMGWIDFVEMFYEGGIEEKKNQTATSNAWKLTFTRGGSLISQFLFKRTADIGYNLFTINVMGKLRTIEDCSHVK